jgi:hypothetical protein
MGTTALELTSMVMIVEGAKKCTRRKAHRFLRARKVKIKFHFSPSPTPYLGIQRVNFTEIQEEFGEGCF